MTREEAIEYLKRADTTVGNKIKTRTAEALEMAIKTLEQEPCEDVVNCGYLEECKELMTDINGDTVYAVRMSDIRNLPPITPQPKFGHWIRFKDFENGYYHIKCSECGQYWSVDGHANIFKHCFNCGVKMEEKENG